MNKTVTEINEADFEQQVLDSDTLTVVGFSAQWCIPCRPQGEILDRLSREYGGRVKFVKLDVDRNSELADKLNIKSVPTLLFFRKNGGGVEVQVGLATEEKLKSRIEKLLQP